MKGILSILVVVCIVILCSVKVQSAVIGFSENNLPKQIIPIIEALQKKDYYYAAKLAKDLIEKEPKNRFALAYLAAAYAGIGLNEKVILLIEEYQQIFPKDINIFLQVATSYYLKGDLKRATSILEEAQKINSHSFRIKLLLAQLYDKLGNPQKALLILNNARQINSQSLEIKILLARLLIKLNKYKEANQLLSQWISENPLSQELKLLRVRVLVFQGRIKEGQQILACIQKHNKDFWATKALLENLSGNIEAAIYAYRKVLQEDPQHIPTLINLGLLYERQKNWQEAVQYFEKVLRLNPEIYQIYTKLIIIYTDYLPNYKRAQELINTSLNKFIKIKDVQLLDAIGWFYYRDKKYDKACFFFSKANQIKKTAFSLYHEGLCLEKIGNRKLAYQKFKEALNLLHPDHPLCEKIKSHL